MVKLYYTYVLLLTLCKTRDYMCKAFYITHLLELICNVLFDRKKLAFFFFSCFFIRIIVKQHA